MIVDTYSDMDDISLPGLMVGQHPPVMMAPLINDTLMVFDICDDTDDVMNGKVTTECPAW